MLRINTYVWTWDQAGQDRRCILVENENRVDINIWRQFDVDLTLDFGYTT